jgi:hypothetical protein
VHPHGLQRFWLFDILKEWQISHSPITPRQMSFTNVEPRLTLEARTMLSKLVDIVIAEGSISPEDVPFEPGVPGDDPRFHQLVKDLVDQTMEFMIDTAHDMVMN